MPKCVNQDNLVFYVVFRHSFSLLRLLNSRLRLVLKLCTLTSLSPFSSVSKEMKTKLALVKSCLLEAMPKIPQFYIHNSRSRYNFPKISSYSSANNDTVLNTYSVNISSFESNRSSCSKTERESFENKQTKFWRIFCREQDGTGTGYGTV